MKTKMIRQLMLALAFALPLACGFAAVAQADPVGIGFVPTTDFVPVMVAKDKGYFDQDGLDAKLTIIPLMSNVPAAIISGSIQIGTTTGPIFLQAQENGLDLVAVAGASRWTPSSQTVSLIAASGTEIKSPADLVGKRVGVPGLNSLIDLSFRHWLVMKGVDWTKVQLVETIFPQMSDLLRSHQLDAALVIEPFRSLVLANGAGTRVSDFIQDINPNFLAAFWVSERGWATSHPAEIAAFRKGLRQGIDAYLNDPEGRVIEMKYLKNNAKVIPAFSPEMTAQDLAFHQELAKEFKLLEGRADPTTLILP